MTTSEIQHGEEKNRSYQVRRQLPGHIDGYDWSAVHNHDRAVQMRARRDICHFKAGDICNMISTSNAGFRGIEGLAIDDGGYRHMGSLGAWDIV